MNSVADIWKIVLSRLSQDLSETTISTWFDEVEAVSIKDRTLYLHCPNDFKRSTIESMFSDRIKDSLRDIYSADFDVKLLSTAESTALFEPEVKKSTALLDSGEFTFDTFVVGESNKMAYGRRARRGRRRGALQPSIYLRRLRPWQDAPHLRHRSSDPHDAPVGEDHLHQGR